MFDYNNYNALPHDNYNDKKNSNNDDENKTEALESDTKTIEASWIIIVSIVLIIGLIIGLWIHNQHNKPNPTTDGAPGNSPRTDQESTNQSQKLFKQSGIEPSHQIPQNPLVISPKQPSTPEYKQEDPSNVFNGQPLGTTQIPDAQDILQKKPLEIIQQKEEAGILKEKQNKVLIEKAIANKKIRQNEIIRKEICIKILLCCDCIHIHLFRDI
jgi:hypothetical protein